MENTNTDYKTYVLGSVDALNSCTRIILFNSSEISALSLQNIVSVVKNYYSSGLIIGASESEYSDALYKKMFKYRGKLVGGEVDTDWGFDILVYLASDSSPLGYTKFISLQGTSGVYLNIVPSFTQDTSLVIEPVKISTDIDSSDTLEERKYRESMVPISEAIDYDPGYYKYSTHISSGKTIFLGGYSVIGQNVSRLKLNNNFQINYFNRDFDHYFIGYYNTDIALYAWSNEGNGRSRYCIVSLTKKDTYGYPIFYTVSKEGRTFEPEYGEGLDVEIQYISGRYICCTVSGLGDDIRIYDTIRKRWLVDDGNYLMSNPLSLNNKIRRLSIRSAIFSDLIQDIPEIKNVYLTSADRKRTLTIDHFVGNSVILENISVGVRSCIICTPVSQLYLMKSEVSDVIFLNDTTLVLNDIVYSGVGKVFCTPKYKNEHPKTTYESGVALVPSRYRRITPASFEPEGRLIAGFSGILFYKDSKNIVKYL